MIYLIMLPNFMKQNISKIKQINNLILQFCFFFQKLSDALHEENGEHNDEYDHEAFLGREESKTFDQLTPEESRERLGQVT